MPLSPCQASVRRFRAARSLAVATLGIVTVLAEPARAETPMPPKLQAVLFRKVFVYNRAFQGKYRVLIVRPDKDASTSDEVEQSFRAVGVPVTSVKASELASQTVDGTVILYLFPQTVGVARELAERNKTLSISGIPTLAERGDVAVAVGLSEDGRPRIIVNLPRAKREGQQFSSDLLEMARTIR